MAFNISNRTKWFLGILGAVVVGALGSGIWDLVFKPSFSWCGNFLLSVGTLGINELAQQMYQEIAKGLKETPSLDIHAMIVGLLAGSVFVVILADSHAAEALREWVGKGKAASRDGRRRYMRGVLASILVFSVIFLWLRNVQSIYVNGAIAHYRQCATICRPVIDDSQARILDARFAMISEKAEYVAVIKSLDSIAAVNQLKLPEFSIW